MKVTSIKEVRRRRKDRLAMVVVGSAMVFAELAFLFIMTVAIASGSEAAFNMAMHHDFVFDLIVILSGLGIAWCA